MRASRELHRFVNRMKRRFKPKNGRLPGDVICHPAIEIHRANEKAGAGRRKAMTKLALRAEAEVAR